MLVETTVATVAADTGVLAGVWKALIARDRL